VEKFPWQLFASKRTEFIDKKFLPAGSELRDPSDMKKDEVDNHLSFWRSRQESEPTAGKVFRFKSCCTGRSSGELEPARYGSRPRSEGKKKRKTTKAGGKVATPATQAGTPAVLPSVDHLFGFPPDSHHPTEHNVVNRNIMHGYPDEGQDNDQIAPCGLSFPPDMQPGYRGHIEIFPNLDLEPELDPELACLLPETGNINGSLYPGEYNIYNNNAFDLSITGEVGLNAGTNTSNYQGGQQQGLLMLPAVVAGRDRTEGTYTSPVSAGRQGLHTSSVHQINLPVGFAGQNCYINVPSAAEKVHSDEVRPTISGSKRKAVAESEGQPVQKRRGRSANQRTESVPEETDIAAAALCLAPCVSDDGILASRGQNQEKRVSARVAKKAADEAARHAVADKAKRTKRSGRR